MANPVLDPLAYAKRISQIKQQNRGQAFISSLKKYSPSADVPLRKKRNVEKPRSSRAIFEVGVNIETPKDFLLAFPPRSNPIFDEVIIEEDEKIDDRSDVIQIHFHYRDKILICEGLQFSLRKNEELKYEVQQINSELLAKENELGTVEEDFL
ncbi:hypothetical protein HAX54_003135 [Datura stramonium]|uniref:Uncharacterized protein n=1 Tax=Datura stramonium TaxID=4076 RepID=A0ABS8T642_DATST|nr:hypothetical protein [Datura stramonium]